MNATQFTNIWTTLSVVEWWRLKGGDGIGVDDDTDDDDDNDLR